MPPKGNHYFEIDRVSALERTMIHDILLPVGAASLAPANRNRIGRIDLVR